MTVRPEHRRGHQPVAGEQADVGLQRTRLVENLRQEQIQRASDRDAYEAEQAEDASASEPLCRQRLAGCLGASVRQLVRGTRATHRTSMSPETRGT